VTEWQRWRNSLAEGKNPCYRCRKEGRDTSGDNFHWYGEAQGGYCHSCEYTIRSKDSLEGSSEDYEEEWELDIMTKEFSMSDWNKLKENCSTDPKGYRGLTHNICKKFGIQHEYDEETGELLRQYYPVSENSKFSGIKGREIPKTFFAKGKIGNDSDLQGS